MRRLIAAATIAALAAGCGDPAGGDLSITVTAPPVGGAIADHSYIIEWEVDNSTWPGAYVNVYTDTDTDPSSGLVLLADSLDVETTGWLWDCSAYPEDDYYIRAVVHEGANDESDYSDGVLTIVHEPLGNVTGVEVVEDSSWGRDVYLAWDPLYGASEYRIYFMEAGEEPWVQLGDTGEEWFLHTADMAGVYGVKGMRDGGFSPDFESVDGTMPVVNDTVYTIWDDTAPEGWPTAAQLTPCGANLTGYDETNYDIHCRQAGGSPLPAHLFSGDAPPLGSGKETPLAQSQGSFSLAPETGWADSAAVAQGDVLFAFLSEQLFYVKILVDSVPENPSAPGGRGVSFHYEFQQIRGLRLFTPASD